MPEALERKWPKAGEKFIWFWFWPSRNLLRDHRSGIIRRHHVQHGDLTANGQPDGHWSA